MMSCNSRAIGMYAIVIVVVIAVLLPVANAAFVIPPNDGFLTDAAGILSQDQAQKIEQKLKAYRDATSNEIAVVIVRTLDSQPIEDAALTIARSWGVGSEKNNGLLMLIAYAEREIRIDVGYGLEGAVPDIVVKGIIDTDITPHFRAGDYASGISVAIDSLQKHIGNEYTVDRYHGSQESVFGFYGFFFLVIALQWLIAILSRTKSWWLGGILGGAGGIVLALLFGWWLTIPVLVPLGLLLDFMVSRNYRSRSNTRWWAGGGWGPGGGGGRGGGFGGFGGGSFGGGGASGRW